MAKRAVVVATVSLLVLASSVSVLAQGGSTPKKGERTWTKSHWGWGVGGVVNRLPIAVSTFNVPLQYICYEHTFGDNPEAPFKTSVSPGLYGFYGVFPVPSLESSIIYDPGPVGGRLSVGAFYDILVGGHWGMSVKLGSIIHRKYELDLVLVPVGEEHPRVIYSELLDARKLKENKQDPETGEWGQTIEFPYYGLLFTVHF